MSKSLAAVLSRAITAPRAETFKLSDSGFMSKYSGAESSSGQTVNPATAMKLSAVWSCVRLVSTSVAGLPLGIYKRQPDGGRQDARDFPLYDVVHANPNEEVTAFQFWQSVVSSMLLHGNAYCEIHRASSGRVISIDFLLPSKVTLDTDSNGRLTYAYSKGSEKPREIPRQNMLHIPSFSLDGRVGMSAIQYGANVFGSAMAADGAANGMFKNGLLPTVAFKVDRILKKEQREEFREYVKQLSGAMNSGKSPVLEQGITPEEIGVNPVDAQLLESRAYGVEEVCRWLGVPPWMVGHTDKGSNWGTGLEQQMIAFLTFSISSITNQIQQCVNKRLLSAVERREYYAEFSLEGFLKADSAARAAFYSTMTQNGIYSRNDCRVKENLSRRDGADELTVQSNLVPLSQLGMTADSQQVRNAMAAWLNDPQD